MESCIFPNTRSSRRQVLQVRTVGLSYGDDGGNVGIAADSSPKVIMPKVPGLLCLGILAAPMSWADTPIFLANPRGRERAQEMRDNRPK
jgi:hypothetical protein